MENTKDPRPSESQGGASAKDVPAEEHPQDISLAEARTGAQEVAAEMDYTAELHKVIEKLHAELYKKDRLITALFFCHVMEHLAGPETESHNKGDKWRILWTEAWDNASDAQERRRDHPLSDLVWQHCMSRAESYVFGHELDGALSSIIHDYCSVDPLSLTPEQWNSDAMAIFQALMSEGKLNRQMDANYWDDVRRKLGIEELCKNKDTSSNSHEDDGNMSIVEDSTKSSSTTTTDSEMADHGEPKELSDRYKGLSPHLFPKKKEQNSEVSE